jgi:hypothetical protein
LSVIQKVGFGMFLEKLINVTDDSDTEVYYDITEEVSITFGMEVEQALLYFGYINKYPETYLPYHWTTKEVQEFIKEFYDRWNKLKLIITAPRNELHSIRKNVDLHIKFKGNNKVICICDYFISAIK